MRLWYPNRGITAGGLESRTKHVAKRLGPAQTATKMAERNDNSWYDDDDDDYDNDDNFIYVSSPNS